MRHLILTAAGATALIVATVDAFTGSPMLAVFDALVAVTCLFGVANDAAHK